MSINHPWQGHYMEPAFSAYVSFMARNHMTDFLQETGETYAPPNSVFEKMIDQATGNDSAFVQRFVDWCVLYFGTPEQVGVAL